MPSLKDFLSYLPVSQERKQAFFKYHTENPEVWKSFESFALQAKKSGATRVGANLIRERVRWECQIVQRSAFKFNNNYTPFYAMMFEAKYNCPEFFENRQLKHDVKDSDDYANL